LQKRKAAHGKTIRTAKFRNPRSRIGNAPGQKHSVRPGAPFANPIILHPTPALKPPHATVTTPFQGLTYPPETFPRNASAIARSASGPITAYPAAFGCTPSNDVPSRIPLRPSTSAV